VAGRRKYSERYAASSLAELNVTPLLDLAFVLLIIFVITTPLLENTVDLIVPTSGVERDPSDPDAVHILSIDKNNLMKLDEQVLGMEQLPAALTQLRATRPDVGIVVRAHHELPVQRLVDVMDAMKLARITKVGVLTQKPEAAAGP
jgi:biopolymer transport protein ExbD